MFFSLTLLVLVSALATHLKGEETSNLQKVARLQSFLLDLKIETLLENVTIKASSLVSEFAEFNNYTQMYLTELTNQRARNTSATGEDLARQMRNQLYILSVLADKLKYPLSTEENKLQTSILQASHDTLLQFVTLSNVLLDKYDDGKNMTMKYSVESDLVLQRTKREGCYGCPPTYKPPYDPPYNPPTYKPPPYDPPYNPPTYKPPYNPPTYKPPPYDPPYKPPTYKPPYNPPTYKPPPYDPPYNPPTYKPPYNPPTYKPPPYDPPYNPPTYKPPYNPPTYKPPPYEPPYNPPTYKPPYNPPTYKPPYDPPYNPPTYKPPYNPPTYYPPPRNHGYPD